MTEKASFEKCHLIWTSWWKKKFTQELRPFEEINEEQIGGYPRMRIYARMEDNHFLANKKSLFYAMREYYRQQGRCVFKDRVFPVTFHIKTGLDDPEYIRLV